ncbi:hypothetical protein L249_2533 [Ophiocordyceps polyrhachis-furcata BCC 54312]|uniref:Uncharacterized protein n=1 Tax=Ophiocordyceps polyrhachis-furcata BCC 54312 TaxID=1330021 RepID=A0A367LRF4_9HYPO|nr:hypothetical protein L249_2533 [Ophiocordyceps polyrhachis-furcata BCC 54312]
MGNDGGSIPKRRELVKNACRAPTVSELKATALESLTHAWSHCALSGEALDLESVVSDWRGRLYNYEAILNGLVPSDEPADAAATTTLMGITSLRDVVKLKFSRHGDKWACPISMKEMGPATKAVYLIPCGHVFAEVAISEIQAETCPECEASFDGDNVIAVLPSAENDTQRLERRMEDLRARGLSHSLKKDRSEKKNRKKKQKGEESKETAKAEDDDARNKRRREETDSRIRDINNPMAASLAAKVLAEQDEKHKRRKVASSQD